MARKGLLLIILLLVVLIQSGQKNDQSEDYKRVYNFAEGLYNSNNSTNRGDSIAILSYHKAILLLTKSRANDSILCDSYVKAGILEMSHQQENAALTDFISSINVAKKKQKIADSSLFKSYLYAGSIYYSVFNYDSALYYYRYAENIVNTFPFVSESERLYNKLGVLHFETGDYKKSIGYFEKALSLVEAQKPADILFIVNYKNNIASALRKLRRHTEALNIYKAILPFGFNTKELLHNIGATYLDEGDPRQAIQYLQQVQYDNQVKYNDLARANIALKQYDSASYFLQKARSAYHPRSSSQKNQDYGITLKYLGDCLLAKHEIAAALEKYHEAIIQVDPDFTDTSIKHNPKTFYGLHNSFLLFDLLAAKAKAFVQQFSITGNRNDLISGFDTYTSALTLAGHVERMYHSDEAKLFLEQNVSEAYKEAVDTGLQLYEFTKEQKYLAQAFIFCENSKASVLQTDLHELELKDISHLPEVLLKEQNSLIASISTLNMQLAQVSDSASEQQIQNSLRDQEIKLSSLQDKLDQDPTYYQQKFNRKEIDIDSIQEMMSTKDGALISYYYYKNKLVCFYITNKTFGYYTSVINKNLFEHIRVLRKQLNDAESSDRKLITTVSTALYNLLVGPVANKINDKKRLLVIPFNELSYIPFEILVPPNQDNPLLYKFSISYNYSANFLSPDNDKRSKYEVLAVAPFTAPVNTQHAEPLRYSRQEVEGLKGTILMDQDATKQQFVALHSQFPVIHLATHAVVNDSLPLQSYIQFYNGNGGNDTMHRLYEQEVYHLNMQKAKLVILSACETGAGQLINEEGIISLSRAFSYAGCKSILTSLWKADDATTAFIIKRVHEYLEGGFSKDDALQRAKIDYLESKEIDARFKTPVYWAHLVLIGNSEPMVTRYYPFYIIFSIAVIVLAVIFFKRNRRQKAAFGSL
jgi:CHAT domain-containing protein/Flp pilus assembly protein TadD